jgi:hypothetical protein
MEATMSGWQSFFMTEAGAAAVLIGFIFLSVSINLKEIIADLALANRALEALTQILGVLFVASLLLIPDQDWRLIALEVAGIGVLMGATTGWLQWASRSQLDSPYRHAFIFRVAVSQVAALAFVLAGLIVAGRGPGGLYWLVPGVLGCFLVALLDAWVLLVEIQR